VHGGAFDQLIEEHTERTFGDLPWIEHAQGPCSSVTGIGKGFFSLGFPFCVEDLQVFAIEKDLSAQRDRAQEGNTGGDPAHGPEIGGDVLSDVTVSAGGRQLEPSRGIGDLDTGAIQFRFDGKARHGAEAVEQTSVKLGELQGGVGVIEGEHTNCMAHLGGISTSFAADALGGRVWGAQVRVGVFQVAQLSQEGVEAAVVDCGVVEDIVAVVVGVDLADQGVVLLVGG
jgi:hypothetical protein